MDIIDFHSHILPSADHGSSSVETSLSQLSLAQKCGVARIVATPHFYPHREDAGRFLKRRLASYEKLAAAMPQGSPEIILGAEILICDNLEEMPDIGELTVGSSKTLLIELPFSDFSMSYVRTVKNLLIDGYEVIIAHADRYAPNNIEKLINVGAKIQLNAKAFDTLFVPGALKDWIKRELVYAIGSDIHGADEKAYKRFLKAQRKIGEPLSFIKNRSDEIWNKAR